VRSPNRLAAVGVKAVRDSVTAMADHPVLSSFLVALGARLVFIAVSGVFHDGALIPDETQYLILALVASEGELNATFWPGYGQHLFDATRTFMWPLTALFWIFGPSRFVGQLLVATFGAVTAALSARLAGRFLRPRFALLAGLIVALFPSQILWSSVVLRETAIWTGLVAIAVVIEWSLRANSTGRILASTLSLGLLFALLLWLREQTAVVALWCLVPAFLVGRRRLAVRLPCAIFLLAIVPWVGGLGLGASDFAQDAVKRLGSSRAYMSLDADSRYSDGSIGVVRQDERADMSVSVCHPDGSIAAAATAASAAAMLDRPTGTWLCIPDRVDQGNMLVDNRAITSLRRVPRGLFDTLVRPLPWEGRGNLEMLMAGLESILWTAIYGLTIYGVWSHRDRYHILLFPSLLILSIAIAGAVSHGNLGTAFRHRGQIMFALAVLATGGIQAIFEVRRQKRPVSAVDLGLSEDFIGDGRR
jgi:hypothetical protein